MSPALLKAPNADERIVQLWERRNGKMEAYYTADEVRIDARHALPEDIRTGPIITVTTPCPPGLGNG